MSIMQRHTVAEHATALAQYLPGGRLFEAAHIEGSNLRQLLVGISGQIRAAELTIKDFADHFIPDDANMLIPDWERALGIPDNCFTGTGTNAERQIAILLKISLLGAQTLDDFIAISNFFDIGANLYPGRDVFDTPALAPGITFKDIKQARYSLVVVYTTGTALFPYTFPLTFGTPLQVLLSCLYNTVKQANCQVLFDITVV